MQSAVIYSRVSTNKQDSDNQIKVLEGWAKERGLEGPSRRCETGTSARRTKEEQADARGPDQHRAG